MRKLSDLATQYGLQTIPKRASVEEVSTLYKSLCKKVPADCVGALMAARGEWVDAGGGGDLPDWEDETDGKQF